MRGGKRKKDNTPSQVVVSPTKKRIVPSWALAVLVVAVTAGLGFVGYQRFYDKPEPAPEQTYNTGVDVSETFKNAKLPEDAPDDGKVSFYLGNADVFQSDGRLAEAMDMIEKAAAVNPEDKQVYRGYAKFYALVGDTENRHKYEQLAGGTVPDVPAEETQRVCDLSKEYKCP